jgi:hypothetical protein
VLDERLTEVCVWEVKLTQGQTNHLFSSVAAARAYASSHKDLHIVTDTTIEGKQGTITVDIIRNTGAEGLSIEKKGGVPRGGDGNWIYTDQPVVTYEQEEQGGNLLQEAT